MTAKSSTQIGAVLREVRTALGFEQNEIGEYLGCSGRMVSAVELGNRNFADREGRYVLLVLAKRIDETKRSTTLQKWMDETEAEFKKKPLGSAFL